MSEYYNNRFNDRENGLYEPSKRSKNFKVNINDSSEDSFGYNNYSNTQNQYSGYSQSNNYGNGYASQSIDYSDMVQQSSYNYTDYSGRNTAVRTSDGDIYELQSNNRTQKSGSTRRKPSSKDKGCLNAFIYALCVCLVSVFFSYWFIVGCNDMFALKKESSDVVVTIPKDTDLKEVAEILKENGIIEYKGIFKFYANITGDDEGFKHGDFVLNTKTDYSEIIRKLTNPASSDGSTVKVVFPEGLTIEKYAELLEENNVCTKEAFIERMTSTVYDFWFLEDVYPSTNEETGELNMDETEKIYLLEGYLFPDTYEFYIDEGSKSAINKMLSNFDSKVDGDIEEQIKSSKWTLDEIITVASIVERETSDPDEMSKVASVLYNRLNNSSKFPYLQSDATKAYPYSKLSEVPADKKDSFVGKYDTYEIKGLPAGAICNPGLNAIKAAVNPADTDYYYFYMDKNGKHYYSKTLDEHNAVIEQCKQDGTAQ